MPGLIALAVFGEQAGQHHCRPQLQGERRLLACDSERFGQAVQGGFTVMLCYQNLRFNPEQFGQVRFRSTIFRTRNGPIDRKMCLFELPGLTQVLPPTRRSAENLPDWPWSESMMIT